MILSGLAVQVKGRGSSFVSAMKRWMGAWRSAALEPLAGELGEVAFDGVEPAGRGRCEVEHEAGMAAEPGGDFGGFVGGIVVQDHVHDLAHRDLGLDGV